MTLEEGDIVLCTVERIIGTIVFVKIDNMNLEGNIVLSEIAPGRIRNLRDYVVPKKKIVCKVIRMKEGQINLSLRRVTQKEQKEVLEKFKQEKSYFNIFKTVLKEKTEKIIEEIKKEKTLYEFIEEIKEDPEKLKKLIGKTEAEKIIGILNSQKSKKAIIKKTFELTSAQPDGIIQIKKILSSIKNAEIKYISAGKYSIKTEAENIKKTDNILKEILLKIETDTKKEQMNFKTK
jgi:translation initiation factor 2 alpha subunit (eIF-2alpha)